MKRICLLLVLPAVLLASCSEFSRVQKSNDYEYKLRMAEQYFVKKKYNYAQQLFEELLPIYKGTDKAENMLYKYAYCAYYQGTIKVPRGYLSSSLNHFREATMWRKWIS